MTHRLPALAPSILSADYARMAEQVAQVLEPEGSGWLHCDIMDGHFVPNISFGPDMVESVRRCAPDAFLDVHLMIERPDEWITRFTLAGADLVSVHVEADRHLHRTLTAIRAAGAMCGVALNPGTALTAIEPVLHLADLVVVMGVNPGFGGQSFIRESLERMAALRALRSERGLDFLIQLDGGATLDNAAEIARHGADVIVAGSALFRAQDPAKAASAFRTLLQSAADGAQTA